mgnify:CR=1 FL=1
MTEATELSELNWRAYWNQQGKDTDAFVGQSSYYEVTADDKLYFGAITEEGAKSGKLYNANGELVGNMTDARAIAYMIDRNEIPGYMPPMGVMCNLIRCAAGGRPWRFWSCPAPTKGSLFYPWSALTR